MRGLGTRAFVLCLGVCTGGLLWACTGSGYPDLAPEELLPPAPRARPPPPTLTGELAVRLSPEGAAIAVEVAEVVAEASVAGGEGRQLLSVDFVEPGGTVFQRATAEVVALPAGRRQAVRVSLPVAGTEAARFPGAWSAVLGGPGGPLASAGFTLREVAP